MATNEEIKEKYNIKKRQLLLTLKDLEEIIGNEGFNGLIEDWNNQIGLFLNDLDKMLNEARADTIKQILEEARAEARRYSRIVKQAMEAWIMTEEKKFCCHIEYTPNWQTLKVICNKCRKEGKMTFACDGLINW